MNVLKVSLKIWKINLIIYDKIVLNSKEGGAAHRLPTLGFRCKGNNSIWKNVLFDR